MVVRLLGWRSRKQSGFGGAKRTQKCGFLHPRSLGETKRKFLILIGVPDGI